jgi:hypothetical protein
MTDNVVLITIIICLVIFEIVYVLHKAAVSFFERKRKKT